MDISVIVPIYGVEKYIEKSLRSLFSQTKIEGVEFILVNDCTPDRSIEIAREVIADFHTLDIKIVEHEVNRGVAAARQTGLDTATGEYTIHFDPDDWCESEMLEEMYTCAIDNDADVIICDFYETRDGEDRYKREQIGQDGIECLRNLLAAKMGGMLWKMLIKRSILTLNNINFSVGLNLFEDMLFCIKVFAITDKITHLQCAYIHYLQRESSIVNKPDVNLRLPILKIMEEIEPICDIPEIYNDLILAKMRFKQIVLDSGDLSIYDKYASIYPEIIPHIMSCKRYSYIRRLGLYLESKYSRGIGRVVYIVLQWLRRLKR